MKITFSVSHQYENKYSVKYIIPMPGQPDALFTSTMTSNNWRLSTLISRAKQVVYSRLYGLRAQGKVPRASTDVIEWDKAVADLPESFKKQSMNALRRYVPAPGTEQETEVRNMEVAQVNGIWTILVKEPLMTWAEACAELKKKVDGNEQ